MYRKGAVVLTVTLIAGLMSGVPEARAAERTLEFRLVTKTIEPRALDAPNVENQSITQSKAFGVGIFSDGRIVTKEYVFAADFNKGLGPVFGYSTYAFDDGSTLTLRFTLESKPNGVGHGEYKILSGTGAYAGATGMGTLDRVASQFKQVGVWNVRLVVTTP